MQTLHNPIGLYEKAMPPMPWDVRFKTMNQVGYDCFELSIDNLRIERLDWKSERVNEIRQCAGENGLRLFSMNLSAHRHFPLGSTNAAISSKAVDIMKKAVDFSYEIGIRVIQLAGYDVYTEEASTQKTKELFIRNLRQGVEYASEAGVMLALEPVDLDFITKCEHAMEYVDLISSAWLQVYPDMANIAAAGHDVVSDLFYAYGHMVAVHVKDGTDRVVRGVPLGEGIVPFEAVFKYLNTIHFKGPYIIEMWGENDHDYEHNIRCALAFTRRHLDIAKNTASS